MGGLRWIGLSLILVFASIWLPRAYAEQAPAADIEAFVREGCSHCDQAKRFLAALQTERPALKVAFYDVQKEPESLERLRRLVEAQHAGAVRVPAFLVRGQLLVGYSDDAHSDRIIVQMLDSGPLPQRNGIDSDGTCEAEDSISCEAPGTHATTAPPPEVFEVTFFGHAFRLDQVGLPAFTVVMGLLDGFNPCSMWVLILMISLLATMNNRWRMLAIAGSFVAVEGIAYFVFMAAWLNLFLFIGLSRLSQLVIAGIAILAGVVHLKDFWAFGWGVSLAIPAAAKPGIYAHIRRILHAENLLGAMIAAVVLAVLVQIVEFLCTSGFPALYTRILTLKQLDSFSYYGYLLLYNAAYMLDDIIILGIGVVTLSNRRLQEREGRWLNLISGVVMVGLGLYLIAVPA